MTNNLKSSADIYRYFIYEVTKGTYDIEWDYLWSYPVKRASFEDIEYKKH